MESLVWVLNPSGAIKSYPLSELADRLAEMGLSEVNGSAWMAFNAGTPITIGHWRVATTREALEATK